MTHSEQCTEKQRAEKTAVLLIAHGSRRAEANDDLQQLADAVRERGNYPIVEIAYLEIASPTIPDGAEQCVQQRASSVLMLPYFLSAGAHVVNDLKKHRNELSEKFPTVHFICCPPLGLHPKMIDVVFARLHEGFSDR